MTRFLWMGQPVVIKATYKNHKFYQKILDSPAKCYFDHYKCELRVIYGLAYDVKKLDTKLVQVETTE